MCARAVRILQPRTHTRGDDTVGIFGPGFQGATARGVTVRVPNGSIDEARAVLSVDRETE